MMEKTRPKAKVSLRGYTATQTTDENSRDNNQKNALKSKSPLLLLLGRSLFDIFKVDSPEDKNDDSDGISGNGDGKES